MVDTDALETSISNFAQFKSLEEAQKIVSLYKGDYLAGFEALWATRKRITYYTAYEEALKLLTESR